MIDSFSKERRSLKINHSVKSLDDKMGICISKMLALAPATHLLHLNVKGQGSNAQHTALNEFYDALPDAIDAVAEAYQGAAEVILKCEGTPVLSLPTVEDLVSLLRTYLADMTALQQEMPYSEVVSVIDDVKLLFNKLKYKLIFLK